MSAFRGFLSFVYLVKLHALPIGEGEELGGAPESADESLSERPQAPSLLLALGLATVAHVLLFLVLTAPRGMTRGAEAASYQVELWPAFQAQIAPTPAPALPEQVDPLPSKLEAPDAEVAVDQRATAQEKRTEPEQQVLDQQPQGDQERPEQIEQNQGCLGPEEMAKLEQARRDSTDSQTIGQPTALGIPCVEG